MIHPANRRRDVVNALLAEAERLEAAIDAVVSADDFLSASEAGGLRFWERLTETERPEWAARVVAVLDLLDRQAGGRFGYLDADAPREDPRRPSR